MGINERKEREKLEMRHLILRTAMDLFLQEGFQHVSLRRIADKIEYSPATIYLYFRDKDDILYALHNEGFEELYKRQREIETIKDFRQRLRKHAEVYLRFAFENPEYYNLMFIEWSPGRKILEEETWQVGRRSYEFLKTELEACMKAGILKTVDLDVATFTLWATVHGIASLILRNRCPMMDPDHLPRLARQAMDYVHEYLGVMDEPIRLRSEERSTS